ncbi:acyl-CoA dehydrogenase [Microcella daejeonensis]|uniref:acyl-CoA dehydrogenase n=1 Tax=Microcella daejeonensis TaxID=2994971 RepID=UPI002271D11B|nr:acyl-CoA dehydrogenase [Microcella daejeonensis]WAB84641.1 acyl-CoA dehydrogenase [Microcella daejeonensis]
MHPIRLPIAPLAPGPLLSLVLADPPSGLDAALALAERLGAARPAPGRPGTRDLWEALATLGAHDLALARAVEPHLDAVAILDAADPAAVIAGCWGVFAAEGGDDPLIAHHADGRWTITGTKPWCSLADRVDRALVTARVADDSVRSGDAGSGRRLFAVALAEACGAGTVRAGVGGWVARGLVEIPSGPVRFAGAPATAVGDTDWYTARPGFAWGGIGVAACWYGGAVGVARTVRTAVRATPDPHGEAHLGAIDEALQSARRALEEAAALAEAGDPARPLDRGAVRLLAKRVRATVARAVDEVLVRAGRALGPAPLALDAAHAKRVADLQLYVRQHHAERDLASLGRALADGGESW